MVAELVDQRIGGAASNRRRRQQIAAAVPNADRIAVYQPVLVVVKNSQCADEDRNLNVEISAEGERRIGKGQTGRVADGDCRPC
jgi:hypothetical protein